MQPNSILIRTALWVLVLMLTSWDVLAQQSAPELDYNYFKNEVQPIFLVKRPGNVACVACHAAGVSSAFRLQPLKNGALFWDEEQSRQNFAAARAFVVPGSDPMQSRLLKHPLAASAGGDPFHGGGKHWISQNDPEWKKLQAWTAGAKQQPAIHKTAVRIVQTNSAGDNVHVIDPATNKVVGVINDIQLPHGVTSARDGSALYISNESLHSLDVVEARTLKVSRRIPLSGRPNNVAIGKDGRFVYVGIAEMPGSVDVVDTKELKVAKTIKVDGAIHNIYVTPDGKFAVAGSIPASTINVIDTAKLEPAWKLKMSAGIRPMTFDTNPDGSTKNIYVQLSGFHGFAVVDFAARKEIARIELPAIEGVAEFHDGLQDAPAHGLAISPDGKTLWCTSKVYGYAYVYSLPDLKEVGRVFVGQHPEWLTFTPDGKFVYIGAAGSNQTFAVDTKAMKEVARIPVGQAPKRIGTAILAVD
ncbi:MAG TPA: hypothetical protein VET48_08305 [Steroidobacteraceae bacterium]|nr:hypothetical protein [Steroidobacteraceae bacterium]